VQNLTYSRKDRFIVLKGFELQRMAIDIKEKHGGLGYQR
jgi:hypothetical protein